MTSQEFSFLQEMVARSVASGGGLLSPATNWTGLAGWPLLTLTSLPSQLHFSNCEDFHLPQSENITTQSVNVLLNVSISCLRVDSTVQNADLFFALHGWISQDSTKLTLLRLNKT